MSDLVAEHQKYIRQAVEFSGLSPTALAKKARLAQTTVTRLFYNRPPLHALNARSLTAIERTSGLPYRGKPQPGGLEERETEPFRGEPANPVTAMVEAATARLNGIDPWVMRSRALEGAGVMPGDILIVDMNAEARRGDVVCAQVGEWERGEPVETMFRLFEPPFLVAQTTVRELRAPRLVDGREATIRGVAIAVIRPRQGIDKPPGA